MYIDSRAGYGPAITAPARANYPLTARLSDLPAGKDGVAATLKHMADFARASLKDPSQTVRLTTLQVLKAANVPPRAWLKEISALHQFVKNKIRYVKDPNGIELVQTPEATLKIGQGDCDDKSTLLAAMLLSIDHPARFVALGFNGAPFSHVLTEAKSAEKWIPAETIIERPLGWFPPNVTSRLYKKV